MTMIGRLQLMTLAAGLMAFTSTACKKQPVTSGMATAGEVKVSNLDVGRRVGADRRVTDKTDTFSPRDTIYASVVTDGAAPNATVTARWTYQDGQVVKEDSRTIAPNGTEATEFHISKPSGWPTGKYKLTVSVGTSTQSKDFEVK
jgi:hypothetical protein